MQHHSAAILLAYVNRRKLARCRITGENKSYDLTVRSDTDSKVEIEVGNTWKCYSEIYTQDSGSHKRIEIRHPSESSVTTDNIRLYDDGRFDGEFISSNGRRYSFDGKLYSDKTEIQGQLTNKAGRREAYRFRLQ